MKIEQIVTKRHYRTWPACEIEYEWEDIFRKEMNVTLYHEPSVITKNRFVYHLPWIGRRFQTSRNAFMFEWNAAMWESGNNKKNIIPCVIDYFLKEPKAVDNWISRHSRNPITLLSSREAYEFLKDYGCTVPIGHLALSLPDQYGITAATRYEKRYDAVLMGRQNPVLMEFIKEYKRKHPDFVYVAPKKDFNSCGLDFNYYTSEGECIGEFKSRKSYFELLRQARVCFYHTPGLDGGDERTKGFNQVTPRFLEYIACGCHILARYAKNADTDYYELEKFSPHIETYEQFGQCMDRALAHEVDMAEYARYLSKHYTTVRVKQLKEILATL